MIVRNEAHVIRELLDSVAPYISSWVIVDTGSDDGTQDVTRERMAGLGIQGELHERPWRDFGHNRNEALGLAQGHGGYIWVMDADDTIVGTPDFTQLSADVYLMRMKEGTSLYWCPLLFRDGLRARWVGVTHEHATWDGPCVVARLEGDYHIDVRQLSSRQLSGQKFTNDRDLLLAELERNPEDARSMFYLGQSYFAMGDFANARKWYARRAEMGGFAEEVYYSLLLVARAMAKLDTPWPQVQDAFLRAWESRPTRAEPLYAIAGKYRAEKRYRLGYLFARHAARMPLPKDDILFVSADVYAWRATDEQATCAFWTGKQAEAFTLWRRVLAHPDVPDDDRRRIAGNRDVCVPAMLKVASAYPAELVRRLVAGPRDGEVTVSLIAGPDPVATEQALNSFLHCCTDVSRVGRFLVIDTGLSTADRAALAQRYGFLEFVSRGDGPGGPDTQLDQVRPHVHTRLWLHLGQGWRFFAPEKLITRLAAVLDAEPHVYQVGVNYTDAATLTGACAPEQAVRRTRDAGRYLLTDAVAAGPAMVDTTRLDQAGGAAGGGPRTASLDEVLCTAAGTPSDQGQPPAKPVQAGVSAAQDPAAAGDGVIFVCGCQRSGNTLMRAMLDSHPRICCGQELRVLPHIARLYELVNGPYRFAMDNYGNTAAQVQALFRTLIDGLAENVRRASGKPRWAEKTPQNVTCMAALGEIFPDARFIHMLRDGRDVACSLVTMDWMVPETGDKLYFTRTMADAARHWRDTIVVARQQAAHPGLAGRVLEVRYEALVTETAATMRRVLQFVGEGWDDAVLSHHTTDRRGEADQADPAMARTLQPVDRSALGRWRRDMTEPDKAAFKAEAGALLTELGYAVADW
jgi:glycosyltransferase involved in cell wall biosynthesis